MNNNVNEATILAGLLSECVAEDVALPVIRNKGVARKVIDYVLEIYAEEYKDALALRTGQFK